MDLMWGMRKRNESTMTFKSMLKYYFLNKHPPTPPLSLSGMHAHSHRLTEHLYHLS